MGSRHPAEVAKDEVVVELDNGRVSGALEERRTRELQGAIAIEQREAPLEAERSVKAFEVESAAVALARAKVEAEVPVELRARKEWRETAGHGEGRGGPRQDG